MISRQIYEPIELIVVLHGSNFSDLSNQQRAPLDLARKVLFAPQSSSLGYCLNIAVSEARGEFIAKIDDDDLYGNRYISEAVDHLLAGHGDIVGKSEWFIYIESSGSIVLKRPGASMRSMKYVAGATLACSRSLAIDVPFRDLNLAEDKYFLEDSRDRGRSVFSSSRRQFLNMRREDLNSHTSKILDNDLMRDGVVIRSSFFRSYEELRGLIEQANF